MNRDLVLLRCRCCAKGTVGDNDWRERCDMRASGEDGLCERCRAFNSDRSFFGHPWDIPGLVTHELLPFGSEHNRPPVPRPA